jgi:hypothetical protein
MGKQDQGQIEDDDLDTLDDFDGDEDGDNNGDIGESPEDFDALARRDESAEQRRIAARREIERRNELKALNSELDEWDDLFDEDDL